MDEFERLLRERRSQLLGLVAASESELAGIQAARTDATADDEHDPEGSTLSTDWSRIAGLQRESTAQLHEINRALERIELGAYGNCEVCGLPISRDRLRVRPWATRCVACSIG